MSTAVTTSVNSGRRVSQTERVRVYRRGRTCAHDGCATILSIYNPAKYCSAHLQELQARRRRTRTVREVPCENCGAPFATANRRRRYCCDRCRMASFARRKRAEKRAEARLRRAQPNEAVASVDASVEPAEAPERELVESAA